MNTYRGSLAEYVLARRGMLGMSQTELAEKAGLSKSEVNAIERGRVLLPGADKRRRLAEALRGFHAELLVAAGEITPGEIIEGANAYDPERTKSGPDFPENSPAARVVDLMRTLPDEMIRWILGTAEFADKENRGERNHNGPTVHVNRAARKVGT